MKVVEYSSVYFKNLLEFIRVNWPDRKMTKSDLEYRINVLPIYNNLEEHNLLILDNDKIIGIQLNIGTKAIVDDVECDILWGYDTKVNSEYLKSDAGMLITLAQKSKLNVFGAGLSEINKKIFKKIKYKFIGESILVMKINYFQLFKLLNYKLKIFKIKDADKYFFPEELFVGCIKYKRILNINDLKIFDDGYWNKKMLSVDFIRNQDFFYKRFFCNPNKYEIYQEVSVESRSNSYFVVRPVTFHNVEALYLVDYRFNLEDSEYFSKILDATFFIAKRNRCPIVFTRTTLESCALNIKKSGFLILRNNISDIVTNCIADIQGEIFVTPADSDTEFNVK